MLEGYEKLNIVDTDERLTGVSFEVNYEDRPEVQDCKILRMKTPDGKTYHIKKDIFMAFLWLIGDPDEQRKMIPQTQHRTKWYETVLSIQAKKDIRKGEKITFPIKLSLPSIEEEAIAEIKAGRTKTNIPLI